MPTSPKGPTPGYLVWRLSMKWRAAVDAAVAPLGLTHALYSVLATLRGMTRNGMLPSQRELAEHTGLDRIYISKIARNLEEAGYIERAENAKDSRALQLTITRKGQQTIDRAIVIVRALQEDFTAPLGGVNSARTRRLMKELQTLIAAPTAGQGTATLTMEDT